MGLEMGVVRWAVKEDCDRGLRMRAVKRVVRRRQGAVAQMG